MVFASQIKKFRDENKILIHKFDILENQLKQSHKINITKINDADSKESSGNKRAVLGICVGGLGIVGCVGLTVMTAGLAAPLALGAVGVVGTGIACNGVDKKHEGLKAKANVIEDSQAQTKDAFMRIDRILETIQMQRYAIKPILIQIGMDFKHYKTEIEKEKKLDCTEDTIKGMIELIAALDCAANLINPLFDRIDRITSEAGFYSDYEKIILKLANHFNVTKCDTPPAIKALFDLIRSKIGHSVEFVKFLNKIELSFTQWDKNILALKYVHSCSAKIQKFNSELNHPTIELIKQIVEDLKSIQTQYDEILKLLDRFDLYKSAHEKYLLELKKKDDENEKIRKELDDLKALLGRN